MLALYRYYSISLRVFQPFYRALSRYSVYKLFFLPDGGVLNVSFLRNVKTHPITGGLYAGLRDGGRSAPLVASPPRTSACGRFFRSVYRALSRYSVYKLFVLPDGGVLNVSFLRNVKAHPITGGLYAGGESEIRTRATVYHRTNPLAGGPLIASWVFLRGC